MANTTLNTRIQLIFEDYNYWNTTGSTKVLLNGEIGFCSITPDGATQPTILLKVGNGVTPFNELPWVSGIAADVYNWAKATGIYMEQEGTGEIVTNISWDSSINNGVGGIKVYVKSIKTEEIEVASEGITATVSNSTLQLISASKVKAINSITLQ